MSEENYEIEKNIGHGAFGAIYRVKRNDGKTFAMKVSPKKKEKSLRVEVDVMSELKDSPYFPELISYKKGESKDFLIMECLGPSLERVIEVSPRLGLSVSTSLRVGIETLRAIKAFHSKGFIHRDIKPSNFLIRNSKRYPLALIDYGISKRIIDSETGEIIPSSGYSGFVGTFRYASIKAHEGLDQSYRDDLFSWFVSLLEVMTGKVPWKTNKHHKSMIYQKKYCDMDIFCAELPKQLISIYHLILNMKDNELPNYDLIIAFLVEAMNENNCKWEDKYDWETFSERRMKRLNYKILIPQSESEPIVPTNLPSTDVSIPYIKQVPPRRLSFKPMQSKKNDSIAENCTEIQKGFTENDENYVEDYESDSYVSSSSLGSTISPDDSYEYTSSFLSTYSSDTALPNEKEKEKPEDETDKKKKIFRVKRRRRIHNTLSFEQKSDEEIEKYLKIHFSEPKISNFATDFSKTTDKEKPSSNLVKNEDVEETDVTCRCRL